MPCDSFSYLLSLFLLAVGVFAQTPKLEPSAWGSSHAGQEIPEFIHGDECLFCHRANIGNQWRTNRHGTTIRQKEDAPDITLPPGATHVLGSRKEIRFLKQEGYGTFQISKDGTAWDKTKFADKCAGCHTTAVDADKRWTAFGLDCYTCHGVVDLKHSTDTSLVWLSKKKRSDVLAVESICAQCHLRGGKSKSTGLPYANNFVVGDNLFRDFTADFSKADDASLNTGDRHVYRNVRDVVVDGGSTTCISCHSVHGQSSHKHRLVLTNETCQDCHNATGAKKEIKRWTVHSAVCEY